MIVNTSGVALVGTALYLIGGNTNDQVTIQHIGSSNTGSTGLQVQGQLNGVNLGTLTYATAPTIINIVLYNGNDTVNMDSNLTVPAVVTDGNGGDNIQLRQWQQRRYPRQRQQR